MGKGISVILFAIFTVLFIFIAGNTYSWQGRMAGMGDPYGLIEDESDFLIHPSGISDGKGINFYSNYRFIYRDVMDWDHTRIAFNPTTGALLALWPLQNSGDEQEHKGLLGVVFPLGTGRMGLFFEYTGKRGDFSGRDNEYYFGNSFFHRFNFDNDLDNFALRLLYGFPTDGFKLGGELQLAYRCEENKTFINEDLLGPRAFYTNFPIGGYYPWVNLHQFLFPYDSKYLEGLLKGSIKGTIGAAKIAFTLRGGFISSGNNKYEALEADTMGRSGFLVLKGDVKGWLVGGDLWLRYPLAKDLSLPFLLKTEYQKKTRDGSGPGGDPGMISGIPSIVGYKNREKVFQIEVGGGVDKELHKGTIFAVGIYYNYFQNKSDFSDWGYVTRITDWYVDDHSNYPNRTEHRAVIRLSEETELSPTFAMRLGLDFFYGWVKEDFKYNFTKSYPLSISYIDKISLNGSHWGAGASLGSTIKFQRFSLEPFVGGGYKKLELDGDGFETSYPSCMETDKLKSEWFIGEGLSISF